MEVDDHIMLCTNKYKYENKAKPMLMDKYAVVYLEKIHKKFVVGQVDKASQNIAVICKTYINTRINELGLT